MSSAKRKKRSSISVPHSLPEDVEEETTIPEVGDLNESTNQISIPHESYGPGSIEYMRYRLSIISNTLPAPKSKLTWINLSHEYEEVICSLFPFPSKKTKKKKVLKDLCGELRGGTMTALIGPTEGGKTTLLKCLSGMKMGGISSGQVLISPSRDEKVNVAFCCKDDTLHENLTLQELLLFKSKISNRVDNLNIVTALIDSLKLKPFKDHQVSKLSLKNKQYTRIASTIITKPDILILDEVTSGLDETCAMVIINKLKEFCLEDNSILIVSITSPSFEIVNQNFQKMFCLSSLGSCIYFGSPNDLQVCFHDISLGNSRLDPIDFLMEISSGSHGNHIVERMVGRTNDGMVLMGESSGHSYDEVVRSQPVVSFWEQCFFLFDRQIKSTFNSRFFGIFLVLNFITAIFIGTTNDGACSNLEKSSNLIIIFIQLTNMVLGILFKNETKLIAFEVERDNWFSIPCYSISKLFVDLFLAIILVFIHWFCSYILIFHGIGTNLIECGYIYSLLILLSLTYSSVSYFILVVVQLDSETVTSFLIVILLHTAFINSSFSTLNKNMVSNMKVLANCSSKPYLDMKNHIYLLVIILITRCVITLVLSTNRQTMKSSSQCCTKLISNIYNRVYHELYVFFNPNSDERLRYDVTQRDARII